MSILIENPAAVPAVANLPAAQLDIDIHVTATMNITAFVARQKVNGFVLSEVGTGLISDTPQLLLTTERVCWRVPVFLSLPKRGRLGQVGTIDIDVQTGEIIASPQIIKDMTENATRLATNSVI